MHWKSAASENKIWKSSRARGIFILLGLFLGVEVGLDAEAFLSMFKYLHHCATVVRSNLLKSAPKTWKIFVELFKKGFLTCLLILGAYLVTLKFALVELTLLSQKMHLSQKLVCHVK